MTALSRYSLSANSDLTSSKTYLLGGYMLLLGIFSVPLFGNAAHNILLGLPILLLLISREIRQLPTILKITPSMLFSALIFLWLCISISWSESGSAEGLASLKKYREFLFIPLMAIFFLHERIRQYAIIALYSSLLLALIASYLIHYNLADLTENTHSLKNRIFHGISMSLFAYMSLSLSYRHTKYKIPFLILFLITLHNLFFIENGRTGYLSILALSGLFILQHWKWKGAIISVAIVILSAVAIFFFVDISSLRIAGNINILLNSDKITQTVLQQTDIRFEYYILSMKIFFENWFFGVGIGSYPAAYEYQASLQPIFWPITTNVHNEFLMIACSSGIVGLILFCSFLVTGALQKGNKPEDTYFTQAVFSLIIISCLFNSSFLDHGDGTFFMIIVALALTSKGFLNKHPEQATGL